MADLLWDKVAVLLHFDGAIVDAKGHAVTVVDATIDTVSPIAGSGSLELNGGNVTVALDAPIGSQEFSLEWLMRLDSIPAGNVDFWLFGPEAGGLSIEWYSFDGDMGIYVWANGVSILDWPIEPVAGIPIALQVTYFAGTYYLLADGALLTTTTYPVPLPATNFIVGRAGASYDVWPGLISEVRLTVGGVRNTADYTPSYGVFEHDGTITPYHADGGSAAAVFRARVVIDGQDVTDWIVGVIEIEAEEGAATIADINLLLQAGAIIYVSDWVRKSVVISVGDYSMGAMVNETVKFTGSVNLPKIGPDNQTLILRCTDDYQTRVGGMTKAALASLIGGYYSSAIFETGASSWVYAQDRLSTVRASLDISPTGGLRMTPWQAKAVADFTFTDDDIQDGSISTDFAEAGRLVNKITITFQYRFPRMKSEGYQCNFDALDPIGFEQYIIDDMYIPPRSQVVSAIESAGGTVESIAYDALPTTSVILHGSGGAPAGTWIPNPSTDPQLCTGWQAIVSFDYAQETDETHTIVVSNPLSIAEIGVVDETMSGALQGEYNDISSVETAAVLYKNSITSIPPMNIAPVVAGMTNAVDVSLSADTDRAAANNAMETLIAIASTKIVSAHRANSVTATVLMHTGLDVSKTVSISSSKMLAKGKVRKLKTRIDTDNAVATDTFDLAISQIAGVGTNHAEDDNVAPDGTTATISTALAAPVVVFNNTSAGDHSLTITFPGVEATERNRAEVDLASAYSVAIQEDLFEAING